MDTTTSTNKHENRLSEFRKTKSDKHSSGNKSVLSAKSEDKLQEASSRFSGQSRLSMVFKSVKDKFKNRRKIKAKDSECAVQNTINNTDPVYSPPIFISDQSRQLTSENTFHQTIRKDGQYQNESKSPYNKLSRNGYYWGSITRHEAQLELQDQPDGTFLIRDSAHERHVYSLSFRSWGKTLHTRIDFNGTYFSISDEQGHETIVDLIADALEKSKDSIYCWSKSRSPTDPNYPVRLTTPLSRFTRIQSLKHKCRFVIREHVNISDIERLELPDTVVEYLKKPYI